MPIERLAMLKGTYDRLNTELQELKKVSRPKVIQEITEARANGDLSENADYHATREKQGEIESKIQSLENKIALAEIIETSPKEAGHVIIGAEVTVVNMSTNKQTIYTLVSTEGVDVLTGRISVHSPIGKGLMGKKVGDLSKINTPKGEMTLKVISFK